MGLLGSVLVTEKQDKTAKSKIAELSKENYTTPINPRLRI
jgi:hypothetical protein